MKSRIQRWLREPMPYELAMLLVLLHHKYGRALGNLLPGMVPRWGTH